MERDQKTPEPREYEPPEIEVVGTVEEATLAFPESVSSDGSFNVSP